jgi:8-oxo-dGTP pyrophosphatase MutT (NUDIX family)
MACVKVEGIVLIVIRFNRVTGHNEVLLQLRDCNRPGRMISKPSRWCLPGGGVDEGEACPDTAAVRELHEELCLGSEVVRQGCLTPAGNAIFCTTIHPDCVPLLREGQGYVFLPVDGVGRWMGQGYGDEGQLDGIVTTLIRRNFQAFRDLVDHGKPLPREFFG